MDPNATLDSLLAFASGAMDGTTEDGRALMVASDDLEHWIERGGFWPAELLAIADDLYNAAQYDVDEFLDFRLYIRPEGRFCLNVGCADYDQDHRGACGAGSVPAGCTAEEARDAILEALNDAVAQILCGVC